MLAIYLLVLAGLLMVAYIYLEGLNRRFKNLPPGPIQLAFEIKHFLKLKRGEASAYEMFREDGVEKYGPILYTKALFLDIVVLQDYDTIKEAMVNKDWVDRIHFVDWFAQRSFGKILGIFVSSGDCWKEMRQFTMRTLRDFGFGKGDMEVFIRDEVEFLTQNISSRIAAGEQSISMRAFFAIPTLNILLTMLTGDRSKTQDPKMINLLHVTDEKFKEFGFAMINGLSFHIVTPNISKILSYFSETVRGDGYKECHLIAQDIMREIIQECRAVGAYQAEPRNFVDAFLKEIEKNEGKNKNPHYTEEQLIVVLMDLFFAGAETTSNTLEFAILYMVLHPEVQAKIQTEIDEVIGSSRFPVYTDKSMMPYTEATILEIHRRCSVVPIFPLSPTKDSKIGKYTIPKGTLGLINMYAMNMDTNTWSDPFEFRPDRFLDAQANVINANKLMPFGAGRRSCYGESLASASLFTFLVTLLQRYTFKLSPEHPVPTMKPVNGVTLSPEPFHCIVQDREFGKL